MAKNTDTQIDWARLDRFGRYVLWSLAKKDAAERFAAAATELTSKAAADLLSLDDGSGRGAKETAESNLTDIDAE